MKGSIRQNAGLSRALHSHAFWQRVSRPGLPVIVAHRGGAAECLENSPAAFERAALAGWPIEMDVRLTADEQVVVFHDPTLERLGGHTGRIDAMTVSEIQSYPLRSAAFPELPDQTIPLLSDVLAGIDNRVPVFLEIKEERSGEWVNRTAEAVAEIVATAPIDQILCMAFNPLVLRRLKQVLPDRPRGFLQGTYEATSLSRLRKWLLRSGLLLPVVQPDFLLYDHRLIQPAVTRKCHRSGRRVGAWTVNEQADQLRCAAAAVEIIITDRPSAGVYCG